MKVRTMIVVCMLLAAGMSSLHAVAGDVNDDGAVDIVDALLVAQYYVGLNPIPNIAMADVDKSTSIDIIDALFIGQYAGGLFTTFPVRTPIPRPTIAPTVSPVCTGCASYTLMGHVYDKSGKPVANAVVYTAQFGSQRTGSDGLYSFNLPGSCPRINFGLWVSAARHPEQYQVGYTTVGSTCGTKQIDFTLVALPAAHNTAGDVWLDPERILALPGKTFTTTCRINTGTDVIASYGLHFRYNQGVIRVDGFTAGADGYLACVNVNTAGDAFAAGFDSLGKGPGTNLEFLTIRWLAYAAGLSPISVRIQDITNATGSRFGLPYGYEAFVKVNRYGDADASGDVDIVDALKVAQYFVATIQFPSDFHTEAADVQGNGDVTIVDALIIAQYCVGIISKFPAEG